MFTADFVESFAGFRAPDQKRFAKALRLLDADERHPSLRVHELTGDLGGVWSASASDDLRIEFLREAGGKKTLLRCSRHYAR
jgi:mRNA-degrading endonuclease YafQ of YafQ-DinJ toxin-antitoxin module